MRRELALISKEYREILASFYIDDKKVSQISREFNLPEGTVKTKLFKSRKLLMEGMKMAREFGIKSYKPEDVQLWTSGIGVGGRGPGPHINYERKFPKNILLEAYCNPSTIEELSLALGVAAPYMEEEVESLVKNELLRKLDSGKTVKYETDFPIISAEAQRQAECLSFKVKDEYYALLRQVVDEFLEKRSGEKLLGGYQPIEELKWMYMIMFGKSFSGKVTTWNGAFEKWQPTERGKGRWDMIGLVNFTKNEANFSLGHGGASIDKDGYNISGDSATFCMFNIHMFTRERKKHPAYACNRDQIRVLWEMYNGRADEKKDREVIDFLLECGVFEARDGKYIPKFAVTDKYYSYIGDELLTDVDESVYAKIKELHMKLYQETRAIIEKDVPEKFRNCYILYSYQGERPLSFAMWAAIKDGYLKLPEDYGKSMIGAWLSVVKK